MSDNPDLAAAEEELASASHSQRVFHVPVVRAISELGGSARKQEVVKHMRVLLGDQLTTGQLDYLESKNRYGWARSNLNKAGLVAGEFGTWELTELGRAYALAHAEDELSIPIEIPESDQPARSTMRTETVPATANKGYELPLLEIMATGETDKHRIFERMFKKLEHDLLPGDVRVAPGGSRVWHYRGSWALTSLHKLGQVENIGTGRWAITEAGRRRLEEEKASWNIEQFRGSRTKVRVQDASAEASVDEVGPVAEIPVEPDWHPDQWAALRGQIPGPLFQQLTARLRPELGPTPDIPLARNIIFYGPPGTGKTHLAKAVARALTGASGVTEDGRFRLVQFHPSYAYEDFVQGLRPDLEHTALRYVPHPGPFSRIAEAAKDEPDAFFVLVIDEINRGDPARIFGELLYALEYREEPVSLALAGSLVVPANLVIIGTMNSVDRSVALVDYALRRRFGFVRVDPDPDVIATVHGSGPLADIGPEVLHRFNEWIARRLDREHTLGHSYFIAPTLLGDREDVFDELWSLDIRPLLEEYFFGDDDGLAEGDKTWRAIVREAFEKEAEVRAEEERDAEEPS